MHSLGTDGGSHLAALLAQVPDDAPAWTYVASSLHRRTDGRLGWVWSTEPLEHRHELMLLPTFHVFDYVIPNTSLVLPPSRQYEHMGWLTRVRTWDRVTHVLWEAEGDRPMRYAACGLMLRWLEHLEIQTPTILKALRTARQYALGRSSRTQYKRKVAAFQELRNQMRGRRMGMLHTVLQDSGHRAAWQAVKAAASDGVFSGSEDIVRLRLAHRALVEEVERWKRESG